MSLNKWSRSRTNKTEKAHIEGEKGQFPGDPVAASQQNYDS